MFLLSPASVVLKWWYMTNIDIRGGWGVVRGTRAKVDRVYMVMTYDKHCQHPPTLVFILDIYFTYRKANHIVTSSTAR